jgi:hypothetical protein
MRSLCVLGLLVACGGGGGFPDARPIDTAPPAATFTLAWTVSDSGNQPVACDKIGALSVTVLAHNRAFDGGTSVVFACATGMGQSDPLPPGTYDFDFQLTSIGGMLATAPAQHGVVLAAGQSVPLMPLAFTVDATGGLALTLATGRAGGNCGVAPNGGGITSTTITLVHTGDLSCEPVTFTISGGGTYTVDCANPVSGPCIDEMSALTASSVPSDNYTIHIKGNIGATTCWTNNDSLQVPAAGQTRTQTFNLAYAMGTPGCP